MTETEFTEGPWEVEHLSARSPWGEVSPYVTGVNAMTGDIADLYAIDGNKKPYPKHNAHANAHLIAAAPEMYAAMEKMQQALSLQTKGVCVEHLALAALEECERVLAKARGEQKATVIA